jgi:hypothetical protein
VTLLGRFSEGILSTVRIKMSPQISKGEKSSHFSIIDVPCYMLAWCTDVISTSFAIPLSSGKKQRNSNLK